MLAPWLDNPVFRLGLLRRRQTPLSIVTILLPGLLCAATILLAVPFYDDRLSIWLPFGQLLFTVLSVGAFFLMLAASEVKGCDALQLAVRDNVADQLLLSGLSPLQWLWGHMLLMLTSLVELGALLLPFFIVCLVLGGIQWLDGLKAFWVLSICAVNVRLLQLFSRRTGNVMIWFGFGGVLVVLPLVGLLAPEWAYVGSVSLLLPFNPCLVLLEEIGTNLLDGFPGIVELQDCLRGSAHAMPLLVVFTLEHLGVAILLSLSTVVGPLRAFNRFNDRQSQSMPVPFHLLLGRGQAKSRLSGRALNLSQTMALFQENLHLPHCRYWEMAVLAAGTFVIGGGSALAFLHLRILWQKQLLTGGFAAYAVVLLCLALVVWAANGACVAWTSLQNDQLRQSARLSIGCSALRMLLVGSFGAVTLCGSFGLALEQQLQAIAGIMVFAGLCLVVSICSSYHAAHRGQALLRCYMVLTGWLLLPPLLALGATVILPGPATLVNLANLSPLGSLWPLSYLPLSRLSFWQALYADPTLRFVPNFTGYALSSALLLLATLIAGWKRACRGGRGRL